MKSISRRLLIRFLIGFGALWLFGGIGIYYSYRAGLLSGLEAELHSLARQVRMSQMGTHESSMGGDRARHDNNLATGANFGPDIYWQVWTEEGGETTLSENLSGELPRLRPKHGENLIRSITLENGIPVMMAGGRFGMGERGVEVSVAKSLESVRRALLTALLSIALIGLTVAGLAVLWIRFAIRDGLAPLRNIADQAASIDIESLGGGFKADEAPSELRPILQRLNELMTRLEKSFSRERRFSSDLAHEMRTPMAELRLLVESAMKWPEEDGPETWDAVLESVDRIETVVQAMLRLARIEQRDASQNNAFEPLELASLIKDAWAIHERRAADRGLTLRLKVDPDAWVTGDPSLWRHLLGNLLENATDYADEGSEIVVSSEDVSSEKGHALSIANAANSLKAEDLEHCFDRFWRGESARMESSHCGLGLALAQACGEVMGWRVRARMRHDDTWLEMRIEPVAH